MRHRYGSISMSILSFINTYILLYSFCSIIRLFVIIIINNNNNQSLDYSEVILSGQRCVCLCVAYLNPNPVCVGVCMRVRARALDSEIKKKVEFLSIPAVKG